MREWKVKTIRTCVACGVAFYALRPDDQRCDWCEIARDAERVASAKEAEMDKPPVTLTPPCSCVYCTSECDREPPCSCVYCTGECDCEECARDEDHAPLPKAAPKTFEGAFDAIFDEAYYLLVDRQLDYGPSNIAKQGIWGVFSRLAHDKVERLGNLLRGTIANGRADACFVEEQGESVEDTLLDIMNYAAILVALRRGWWGLPVETERP